MRGWIKAAGSGVAVMVAVLGLVSPAAAGSFWPGAWGPRPGSMPNVRVTYTPAQRASYAVNSDVPQADRRLSDAPAGRDACR